MRLLIILLIFFTPAKMISQDIYYVSHIHGIILNNNKDTIKIGQPLTIPQKLTFASNLDFATLINPLKGTFITKKNQSINGKSPGEFIITLSDLLPSIKTRTMATRSGMVNSLYDLETYLKKFTDSNKLLIAGTRKIPLNPASFTKRKERFFFISYVYNGDVVNNKLSFLENKAADSLFLVLDKKIFVVADKLIDYSKIDAVKFFYYNEPINENTLISATKISYYPETDILKELAIVKESASFFFANRPDKQRLIKEEIQAHIASYWGSADDEYLQYLLQKVK